MTTPGRRACPRVVQAVQSGAKEGIKKSRELAGGTVSFLHQVKYPASKPLAHTFEEEPI